MSASLEPQVRTAFESRVNTCCYRPTTARLPGADCERAVAIREVSDGLSQRWRSEKLRTTPSMHRAFHRIDGGHRRWITGTRICDAAGLRGPYPAWNLATTRYRNMPVRFGLAWSMTTAQQPIHFAASDGRRCDVNGCAVLFLSTTLICCSLNSCQRETMLEPRTFEGNQRQAPWRRGSWRPIVKFVTSLRRSSGRRPVPAAPAR
jgi:hypothetical protein